MTSRGAPRHPLPEFVVVAAALLVALAMAAATGQPAGHAAVGKPPAVAFPSRALPEGQEIAVGSVRSTVGQLLMTRDGTEVGGDTDAACTATVVASDSGTVAVTAAHCVYLPPQTYGNPTPDEDQGWVGSTRFVPGRHGEDTPYGVWDVDEIQVDPRWQDEASPAHDIAWLRLAKRDGRTAQEVLGAQGIAPGAASPDPAQTTVGYPVEGGFPGDRAFRCATEEAGVEPALEGDYAMACDFTAGASGGPWFSDFDETTGLGTVTAVTTFRFRDSERITAARFDDDAMQRYRSIDRSGQS